MSTEYKPKRKSELTGGLIPKNTQCPFADCCLISKNCPAAAPQGHPMDYSCGMARFIDIFGRPPTTNPTPNTQHPTLKANPSQTTTTP
jgi:hypothetical protein